jgi:hypothetical protein
MQVVTPRINRNERDGKMKVRLQRGYALFLFSLSVRVEFVETLSGTRNRLNYFSLLCFASCIRALVSLEAMAHSSHS